MPRTFGISSHDSVIITSTPGDDGVTSTSSSLPLKVVFTPPPPSPLPTASASALSGDGIIHRATTAQQHPGDDNASPGATITSAAMMSASVGFITINGRTVFVSSRASTSLDEEGDGSNPTLAEAAQERSALLARPHRLTFTISDRLDEQPYAGVVPYPCIPEARSWSAASTASNEDEVDDTASHHRGPATYWRPPRTTEAIPTCYNYNSAHEQHINIDHEIRMPRTGVSDHKKEAVDVQFSGFTNALGHPLFVTSEVFAAVMKASGSSTKEEGDREQFSAHFTLKT